MTSAPRSVILASASPRRKELLARSGIPPFTVEVSSAEERGSADIYGAAMANAFAKASAVALKHPSAVVVGADTVIEFGNSVLGKPDGVDGAERMLALLSGKTHNVTTGVAVIAADANICVRFAEVTRVTFRTLSPETIKRYISEVEVLDKAGAYAVQDHGEMIIERVEGDLDNVIGLPSRTAGALKNILQILRPE